MTMKTDLIRQFLAERGKSKEWLAAELNLSLATVTRVLAGRAPRAETLVKLAKLMGCRMEDLLAPDGKRRTA